MQQKGWRRDRAAAAADLRTASQDQAVCATHKVIAFAQALSMSQPAARHMPLLHAPLNACLASPPPLTYIQRILGEKGGD